MPTPVRTPAELFRLFLQYDQTNDFELFIAGLSFEEITMICMVTELMLKNPSIAPQKEQMYKAALNCFKEARKKLLERN
jgi:hypothetical protein